MPKIMVLDEPTSMLDPISRKQVFNVLAKLKEEQKNTIIVIEHSLENLIPLADRMVLLHGGELLLENETQAFFQQLDLLLEKDTVPPGAMHFFHLLAQAGYETGYLPLSVNEAAERLRQLFDRLKVGQQSVEEVSQ
jgi:energy-coupling factor transport system ATP-binding protein